LRRSGLARDTVAAARIYTETDPLMLNRLVGGCKFDGSAMVFPFFNLHGRQVNYNVLRPSRPRRDRNGKLVKYEVKVGAGLRAYLPPLKVVLDSVNTPGAKLLMTEGILKALAGAQAGLPCLGLMGFWGWCIKDSDPKKLIGDLAAISWRGRLVLIVPDRDPTRKPGVNHGAAELARVLTDLGADVRIVTFPPYWRVEGTAPKIGMDDFLMGAGPEALHEWAAAGAAADPLGCMYGTRAAMESARRRAVIGRPWPRPAGEPVGKPIRLDRSPPGTGKSTQDVTFLTTPNASGVLSKSLTINQNHDMCEETANRYAQAGMDAAAYPRFGPDTCRNFDEAEGAVDNGFPVTEVVCPKCRFRDGCPYREGIRAAGEATHAICTTERARLSLPLLADGRGRISIHEDLVNVLRPIWPADRGLEALESVARAAALEAGNPTIRGFLRGLREIAESFHVVLNDPMVKRTAEVSLPDPLCRWGRAPEGALAALYGKGLEMGFPPPNSSRLVMAAALGQLDALYLCVEQFEKEGGPVLYRSLRGLAKVGLPAAADVLINDSTANPADIAGALRGRAVEDITPPGRLPVRHTVVQVIPARDVTIGRETRRVVSILRGLLHDLPCHWRIGLLTHQKHAEKLLKLLGKGERNRLVKVEHFRGTQSRGSNKWVGTCDAIVILGTPRVPPAAIRDHLLRIGKPWAARLTDAEARWGKDWWSGLIVNGSRRTVQTSHYADHDWHDAYRSLVVAELRQAVGRGRGILKAGVPVYLVSTENTSPDDDGRNGYPLAEAGWGQPLTGPQARVLGCLFPDQVSTTAAVAGQCGRSEQWARKFLGQLLAAGRVRKFGERKGWLLNSATVL
jgi:hypothetical protein